MKPLVLVAAGAAGGIALVIACGQGGPGSTGVSSARASPNDCTTWEYANTPSGLPTESVPLAGDNLTITATILPSGWEPFGVAGTAPFLRRCKP